MDPVFKALGDPTRRAILDRLRASDGLTVSEIEAGVEMSRFGVMKHLAVLEAAGLVTTRRAGRFKHVHLNVVPLQQILDRWIDPMLRPWSRRLEDLKQQLEKETEMTVVEEMKLATTFRMETYIRTTAARLWQALTDPEDTSNYYFGSAVRSDWAKGTPIEYILPDETVMLSGEIIAVEPEKRLVTTFVPHWNDGGPNRTSRVTYEIEQIGDLCKLVLTHEGITEADGGVREGWSKILAGLKSLIETGEALSFPRAG
ncbi:MAG: metalloregulator ArsR/SmtB family transcription factor [Pseudomonadota bacterium]